MPDARHLLVLNAGSSSLKFALFDVESQEHAELTGNLSGLGATPSFSARNQAGKALEGRLPGGVADHAHALTWLFRWLSEHGATDLVAAGHRVVHGGDYFDQPVRVTAAVESRLEALTPLAPLHQPHNLAAIRALRELQPSLPQVACFDTAFHRTQPNVAQACALPPAISALGVRRYGFHGLSYEYIASELPRHLGPRADDRVIVAHLGNGASLCAMLERKSIATTMGFTALDGLVMGTRCGTLDPGVLLYLMQEHSWSAKELENLLYRNSGMLGVSGISSDVRDLLASDQPSAREALELFCYRAVREIGSLAAALGGLDTLVFTAGIGEHAAAIRKQICAPLQWLGLQFDDVANRQKNSGAFAIGTPQSRVAALVIPTNEEAIIARHTTRVLKLSGR